jgi:D-galactarolactone isomerase
MHVYGPESLYPIAPTARSAPPTAYDAAAYKLVQQRLGMDRVVVVQPSAYGTDNSATLDGMAAFGPGARGIAMVGLDVSDDELQALTDAGVRGQRLFMLPGGPYDWDELSRLAARVAEAGWHVQLQLDGRDLPDRLAVIETFPDRFVIDHTGKFLEPVEPDHPAFETLLRLVDGGRCWVKLSAPYETSKVGPPHYDDVGRLARILVQHAPERMLWATNWPHPTEPRDALPDDAMLLDVLLDWVPDAATRQRILVDNPAELYGY